MRPQILIPFEAAEALSIAQAARVAGRSDDTVRRWAQLHCLGRRIGGRWMISRFALRMFLEHDLAALEALLAGDRSSDVVRRHMEAVENSTFPAANPANPANAAERRRRSEREGAVSPS